MIPIKFVSIISILCTLLYSTTDQSQCSTGILSIVSVKQNAYVLWQQDEEEEPRICILSKMVSKKAKLHRDTLPSWNLIAYREIKLHRLRQYCTANGIQEDKLSPSVSVQYYLTFSDTEMCKTALFKQQCAVSYFLLYLEKI